MGAGLRTTSEYFAPPLVCGLLAIILSATYDKVFVACGTSVQAHPAVRHIVSAVNVLKGIKRWHFLSFRQHRHHPAHVYRSLEFHSWGYTYSIFFDGNAFHWGATAPSLSIDDSGCSAFSTTIDGVLTALDGASYSVAVSNVADGGFILSQSATADEVTEGLSFLPSVSSPMLTYRGVADEHQANSWTMSFSSNGGSVPQLVCITEEDFDGSCDVSAPIRSVCPIPAPS